MKTNTINLSIPAELLKKADAVALKEMRSRSEVMRTALQVYIEKRTRLDKLFSLVDEHVAKRGLKPADVAEAVREVRARK